MPARLAKLHLGVQGDLHDSANVFGVRCSLGADAELRSELTNLTSVGGLAIEQYAGRAHGHV